VLVVPIGFVADHLEILYDIDIEAQAKARQLGLTLRRTESLNTDPELVEGLAEEILRAATP
jgi:ferrochelatase